MHRFYVENLEGAATTLPAGETHHAMNVLRLPDGTEVELFDGRGRSAVGVISRLRKGEASASIKHLLPARPRVSPAIHLAFAVPKGKRLDWLLEKATELGAASLRAVVFERSVAGGDELTPGKQERWLGHCISAGKQSGQIWLPELRATSRLGDFLRDCTAGVRLFGHLGADARPMPDAMRAGEACLKANAESGQVTLLVGPEGGLTDAERAACQTGGFAPVRVGRTTLRIETAAVALLAATRALLSE